MSLRRRLTLVMALLLAVGLAAADLVTYAAVKSFLYGRLDVQVDNAQRVAYAYLVHSNTSHHTPSAKILADRLGPDVYVEVLGSGGAVVLGSPSGTAEQPDAPPVLPAGLRAALAPPIRPFGASLGAYHPLPGIFNVPAAGAGHAAYRVDAVVAPQGTLVVAIPLTSTQDTLASLREVEIIVSAVLLATLCAVALVTVRRGLRPLEGMAETADAIAEGDLSRRVDPADPRSEIGRFGTALNRMLAEIETAFSDKSASEARLRQFVADASHELRTPLTSIRGYTELLRRGAFPDEESRQRALSRVEAEATRMSRLVDDLLLLARIDQGRPLADEPVDLRRVAADAVHDARAVEPDRPIGLAAPEAVVVRGDRDRLGQAVQNLLANARNHTPVGTPVDVEVHRRGGLGVVRVVDHGPGIPRPEAERVFDRFYRVDPSRSGSGTGLGLAIVRAIATALGGTAEMTPTPGGGATFTVAIPLEPGGDDGGAAAPEVPGALARRPQLTG